MDIIQNIHYVGVNDRSKDRFEGLWPLPYGVSYNSYLITDEKVTLIDTVDICYFERYLQKIERVLKGRKIDYLVINHMEPDHSGSIRLIVQHFPGITLVGNAKTKDMVEGFYGSFPHFLEVKESSVLSLGAQELHFYMTPMVHWPETMVSYCPTAKVLFSGDAFGCFGALDGGVLDTQIDLSKYWDEMIRYYSNIVGKYGSPVQKALQKLSEIDIRYICSTHGPVWHTHIEKVIDMYDKMSRYEPLELGVVVAYGTMYGNTEVMAEAITEGIVASGVKKVVVHNLVKTDVSYVVRDIFKYGGLVVGSPTYSNDLFPMVQQLLDKLKTRDVKQRRFAGFGGYTWASAAVKRMAAFAEEMKWDIVVPSVDNRQGVCSDKLEECYRMGHEFGKQLQKQGA